MRRRRKVGPQRFGALALRAFASFCKLELFFLDCAGSQLSMRYILVVACIFICCGMQSQLWHVRSSSPTRDRTWALCIGSMKSLPADHQESPLNFDFWHQVPGLAQWDLKQSLPTLSWDSKGPGASGVVLVVKNPLANAEDIRDVSQIPGLERYPGGGHGNPLQYSCLENPTEEPGGLMVHRVTENRTQLK